MPYIQCNGADLYYEDHGEGPPIVFLHGVMASHRFFEPQLTALSKEYRTIAVDFRGHGRSEKTELGHTVTQYARDLQAFLSQHERENVVLVGWSMGALVSWEYVDQFGTKDIRGLVDVDMEASRFQWDDYEYGLTDLDGLQTTLTLAQQDQETLIERITEQVFKEPPSAETRNMVFDELSRVPAPIKSAILFDALTRDYRDVLHEIDVPTVVCAGADEKRGSVASTRHVAEIVSEGSFELFEESGHCPTLEEPERFNRIVSQFTESL
ncbi:alpha/beta hydrolase fold protein (plasmid) [Haloterrigena turkmenica DSM 5511]|uniref:Alpha/beta hydrolase fold protein n=1 Tax=Haloterrigena turkmenica (strain ATCC 51198 / DSM 5511 / JCM 9101 / NCIMB 13204 / VKM B-1734 / 4k) TaxID=543526 RepID=D2S100_HALTV|nr:alpha/beta hydrolase [Haloterrigena turkmenica]ADB63047.1 alpha/beta hydrolase fold protein [Haloterrigena turkmenica DSM 5511]